MNRKTLCILTLAALVAAGAVTGACADGRAEDGEARPQAGSTAATRIVKGPEPAPAAVAVGEQGARALEASETSAPAPVSANGTQTPLAFDGARASRYLRTFTAVGLRRAGSYRERKGAYYVEDKLEAFGYTPRVQRFSIPGGKESRNVYAIKPGRSTRRIVIGAHMDSKVGPGGNDNGSGVAATLELARDFARSDTYPTIVFVFFGAEEVAGRHPWQHHFGSKKYVTSIKGDTRKNTRGMLSLDMIGYGSKFHTRTMGLTPGRLASDVRSKASSRGVRMTALKDSSRYGSSDHEPFENASIPAVWVEWRNDPDYHTKRDTATHVQMRRVRTTGALARAFLMGLDGGKMDRWDD